MDAVVEICADSGIGGYDSVCGKMRNNKWRMFRATYLLITLSGIRMLRYPAMGGGITILNVMRVAHALCARERGKEHREREVKDR